MVIELSSRASLRKDRRPAGSGRMTFIVTVTGSALDVQPYSSALHKDNFYATQFHPEKSGSVGERILRNFITKGGVE